MASEIEVGTLIGILIGEGHFGGDGRQPHVTLRMNIRHESLFHWIDDTFPGGKLYGPYHHDGRHYYQWMARGIYLREILLPLLERHLTPDVDAESFSRFLKMKSRYARQLGLLPAGTADTEPEAAPVGTDAAAAFALLRHAVEP